MQWLKPVDQVATDGTARRSFESQGALWVWLSAPEMTRQSEDGRQIRLIRWRGRCRFRAGIAADDVFQNGDQKLHLISLVDRDGRRHWLDFVAQEAPDD